MGIVKIFGWILLISGIGTITLPLISGLTGFAVANLDIDLPVPHISFSPTTFVIGVILASVGMFVVIGIANFEKVNYI